MKLADGDTVAISFHKLGLVHREDAPFALTVVATGIAVDRKVTFSSLQSVRIRKPRGM